MHPRILDHTPAFFREMALYAQELSHGFVERDFDHLQNISNLLNDVADEKTGARFTPEPRR